MDGSGSNLTIDFSDASFDNSSDNEQPIPGVDNIDVVFPLDDNPEITVGSGEYEKTGHDYADNRNDTNTSAQAIALMPNDSIASAMDEFVFEFDNDENNDGDTTTTDQGLKITSKAEGQNSTIQELNLEGSFENLHDGGTLDVHVVKPTANGDVYDMMTLGMSDSNDGTMGSVVGGDTDGGNMGGGNDTAVINVDATTTIQGMYKGGSGFDTLQLVEGVRSDNGAIVDFYFGEGGTSSAEVLPASNLSSEVAFQIDEWESIQLTDNADTILISGGVGSNLTNSYDAPYWNPGASNSMLKLQTGYTDGGAADIVKVNADSDLYMSFEFANDSDVGIDAIFYNNGYVEIESIGGSENSPTIDVEVDQTGGSGMVIDYLEATSNKDEILNTSDIGVMVDLGGSTGDADVFEGSSSSKNDVLDARAVQDLEFSSDGVVSFYNMANPSHINVKSVDSNGDADNQVNAKLSEVDYIMVTDSGSDVDFYEDMSHLNLSQIVDGLGAGASDAYGVGYDVVTSAQVDSFADDSSLRVYYEGDHDDFIDIDDDMTYTDGVFTMSNGDSSRGSTWESEIDSQYGPGQDPGFYIEVGGKKLAVTMDHEKGAWKVDTTAIKVAEDASGNINMSGIDTGAFASSVLSRYGLNPAVKSEESGSESYGSGSYGSGSDGSGSSSGDSKSNFVIDSTDNTVTQAMIDGDPDYWYPGQRYDMINLPNDITGQVDVWNQTLPANSRGDYTDLIIGILDKTTGKIVAQNDDDEPNTEDYTNTLAVEAADSPNHRQGVDSFISFNVVAGHEYAVMVGDLGESNEAQYRSFDGGGYDLYAVSDVGGSNERVVLSTNSYEPGDSGSGSYGSGSYGSGSYGSGSYGSGSYGSGSYGSGSYGSGSYGSGSYGSGSYGSGSYGSGSYGSGSYGSGSYGSGSYGSGSYGSGSGSGESQEGHSFSNDIYLNASEEAIQELLANGSVSDKAFNFSFYTKMDLVTDEGTVTVNVKLQEDGGNQFSIDADDIDVAVESFYNVAEDAGAAVTSSSAAGEFVKIDDAGDIALGNGGDDTYVVGDDGADIYGGIALEYGNLNQYGGLIGSVDAVNFNSVDSVSELTFRRGELRNEEEGSTLFIGQSDGNGGIVGNETVLFDNYNEYLDFRRVEYLTVEDGANNNEIYEIVTNSNDNISDWDNEIYVANGGSMDVELGGIDYVIGSDDADTFNVSLSDMMSAGSGTINLSNVTSDDTINVTDASSYNISTEDEAALEAVLAQGIAAGGGQVEFSSSEAGLSIKVDSLGIDETYNIYDYS